MKRQKSRSVRDEQEPVRVAQIIGKLNAAGVESVMNNYYRHIDREKYQFDFIIDADGSCQPKQELAALGACFYTVAPYQRLFSHVRQMRRLFRANNYRVVHAGMNSLSVISLFAAWSVGVPVRISHSHNTAARGEFPRNLLKNLLRPFSRVFATHLCACSAEAGIWLFGRRAFDRGNITVLPNAIEPERFSFDASIRTQVRARLGLENALVVGHVGRACYQKNQPFVLELFARLHRQHAEARLLLVGLGTDGQELKDHAARLGIRDTVLFLGARDDIAELYQAMDAFVFPSRYEGLGLAAVEAQCAGLPTIVSTAVPAEAKVSEHLCALPLKDGPEVWARTVIQCAAEKKDRVCEIDPAYDIRHAAQKLQRFYDRALANTE